MTNVFLEELSLNQIYFLASYDGIELYQSGETHVPCAVYRGQRTSDAAYCEVRVRAVSDFTESSPFTTEIEALNRLKHKHVVEVVGSGRGVLTVGDTSSRKTIGIVDYMALELLFDWNCYLNCFNIPDSTIRQIFKKVVKTAAFVASKGVPLRNFQFENIKCNGQGIVKISNFTFSMRSIATQVACESSTVLETRVKRSPECSLAFAKWPVVSVNYALGVILLKMKLGPNLGSFMRHFGEQVGFQSEALWNFLEIMSQSNIGLSLRNLLKAMLCGDGESEFSFTEILAHPWIRVNLQEAEFADCETHADR